MKGNRRRGAGLTEMTRNETRVSREMNGVNRKIEEIMPEIRRIKETSGGVITNADADIRAELRRLLSERKKTQAWLKTSRGKTFMKNLAQLKKKGKKIRRIPIK
ncbi:MAG: hypothetical protein V1911_03115 [Candidatus Micrarchaeota archaeon]